MFTNEIKQKKDLTSSNPIATNCFTFWLHESMDFGPKKEVKCLNIHVHIYTIL